MYDWANSVYSLTITTAIFPIYFAAVTKKAAIGVNAENQYIIDFLGFQIPNSVLYSYSLSIAFLAIALINPLLSGIADYSGSKKSFMKFFAFMGAFSCSMLFFFNNGLRTRTTHIIQNRFLIVCARHGLSYMTHEIWNHVIMLKIIALYFISR